MYTRVLHMTSTNWRRTNKEELILVDKNLLRHLHRDLPECSKICNRGNRKPQRDPVSAEGNGIFSSDLHGEHEAFIHMLKSASGVIRSHIEEIFARSDPGGARRTGCTGV